MANGIPLDQVSRVVAETLRQIQNGRAVAQKAGISTTVTEDDKVQFQLNILAPGGVNAIPRNSATKVEGNEVTTTKEDQSVTVEDRGSQRNQSTATDSGRQDEESDNSSQNGTEETTQNFGRQNQTDTTYEN